MENSQLKRAPRQEATNKKKAERPGPALVAEEQKTVPPRKKVEGNFKSKVKKETPLRAVEPTNAKDIYQKHGEPRATPQKQIDHLRMKGQGKALQQKTSQKQRLTSKEETPTKQALSNQPSRITPTIAQRNQARREAHEGRTVPIRVPGKYQQSNPPGLERTVAKKNDQRKDSTKVIPLSQGGKKAEETIKAAKSVAEKNQQPGLPEQEVKKQQTRPGLIARVGQAIEKLRERTYRAVKNVLDSVPRVRVSSPKQEAARNRQDNGQVANLAANKVAAQVSNKTVVATQKNDNKKGVNQGVDRAVNQIQSGPVLAKVAKADQSAASLKQRTISSEQPEKRVKMDSVDRARAAVARAPKFKQDSGKDFYQRQGSAQGVSQKEIDAVRQRASQQQQAKKVSHQQEKGPEQKVKGETDYKKVYEQKVGGDIKKKRSSGETGLRVDTNRDMVENFRENASRNYKELSRAAQIRIEQKIQKAPKQEKKQTQKL